MHQAATLLNRFHITKFASFHIAIFESWKSTKTSQGSKFHHDFFRWIFCVSHPKEFLQNPTFDQSPLWPVFYQPPFSGLLPTNPPGVTLGRPAAPLEAADRPWPDPRNASEHRSLKHGRANDLGEARRWSLIFVWGSWLLGGSSQDL